MPLRHGGGRAIRHLISLCSPSPGPIYFAEPRFSESDPAYRRALSWKPRPTKTPWCAVPDLHLTIASYVPIPACPSCWLAARRALDERGVERSGSQPAFYLGVTITGMSTRPNGGGKGIGMGVLWKQTPLPFSNRAICPPIINACNAM